MKSSKYIFLSHVLSNETVGYGGKKDFRSKRTLSIREGNSCNQSEWQLNNHIGTHVDAPFHFSDQGLTLDQFAADFWSFTNPQLCTLKTEASCIIDVGPWCDSISVQTDLLLLKTGFEEKRDTEDYWAHNPGLAPELGTWLRTHRPRLRMVGLDFISVTSYDHRPLGKVAHHAFLHEQNPGRPLMVIEDMHLSELHTNPVRVTVAPVRVKEADGGPVTVIAEI
jgi:arylformamidase